MKTTLYTSSIRFSDDEKFNGKKVYGAGDWERSSIGDKFFLDAASLSWARDEGKKLVCTEYLDEEKKKTLLPYIKREARKENIVIEEW